MINIIMKYENNININFYDDITDYMWSLIKLKK